MRTSLWLVAVFFVGSGCASQGTRSGGNVGHKHGDRKQHGGHADGHGDGHGHQHGHRFDKPEEWLERFEGKERTVWQRPDEVVASLQLRPTDRVADIGSGTGYFSVRIAKHVSQGRVWGIDIEPAMVRYLNDRARNDGLGNVFSVLGTADDPLIPEPVDVVIVVNTYHHIEKRVSYLQRLQTSLRPGAKVVIVDFKKGELPVGPPDSIKFAPEIPKTEFAAAGYKLLSEDHKLLPHQYVLTFQIGSQ